MLGKKRRVARREQREAQRADRAWSLLQTVNEWISHADAKATTILAFIAAVTAAVVVIAPARADLSTLQGLVMAGLGLSTIVTWLLAASVLWPRTRAKTQGRNPLFFADITQRYEFLSDYNRHLIQILDDHASYANHITQQIRANARVATKKFRLLNWATRFLFLSVTLLLLLVALLWWDVDGLSAVARRVRP